MIILIWEVPSDNKKIKNKQMKIILKNITKSICSYKY
jgi:hypothetical protein